MQGTCGVGSSVTAPAAEKQPHLRNTLRDQGILCVLLGFDTLVCTVYQTRLQKCSEELWRSCNKPGLAVDATECKKKTTKEYVHLSDHTAAGYCAVWPVRPQMCCTGAHSKPRHQQLDVLSALSLRHLENGFKLLLQGQSEAWLMDSTEQNFRANKAMHNTSLINPDALVVAKT